MYTSQVNYEQSDFGYKFVNNYLPPVVENYVARLNGDGQYWQLSDEINTGSNFDFSISTQIETSGPSMITGANNSSAGCFFHSNGRFIVRDSNSVTYTTVGVFPIGDNSIFDTRVLVVNGNLSMYVDGALQVMDRANDGTFSGLFLHRVGRRAEDTFYNKGITYGFLLKDISGNVLNEIPLTNKAQGAYQVATTTPLGENLYTQTVIENPFLASSQWSYLGEGRWFLDGQGDNSPIVFIKKSEQPQRGYVEFEIESITGGFLTCTSEFIAESRFDTAGVKTFYYENIDDIFEIQFKRSVGSVKTVIKNIKHYDADGVLVATMVNYDESVWEQV